MPEMLGAQNCLTDCNTGSALFKVSWIRIYENLKFKTTVKRL
jgi:hypothetical protein